MTTPAVQMIELEAHRVAAAFGFGEQPELEAWDAILRFAADQGLDPWSGAHRFFGFNNPNPSPGSPNYGYEQWMTVGVDVDVAAPLEAKEVHAGRYAALRFRGLERIGASWEALGQWCEDSGYEIPGDPELCLEELHTPVDRPPEEWEFTLLLGIGG